jgi:hypothetical protein
VEHTFDSAVDPANVVHESRKGDTTKEARFRGRSWLDRWLLTRQTVHARHFLNSGQNLLMKHSLSLYRSVKV